MCKSYCWSGSRCSIGQPLLLTQTSWVLPPLSVGKMTLRLYGALNYSHGLSKGRVLAQDDVVYYHHERNHQGKENLLLFPASDQLPQSECKVRSRERLGGLLRFYHREAA